MWRRAVPLAAVVGLACSGDGPTGGAPTTSFARLQADVFTPSCASASCHATGAANSSGLALSGSGGYASLVNALPTNAGARADGLRRVMPGKPDSSLLWHKLNGHAAGHHARDYGLAMPPTGTALRAGQLEFIRQWIAGGASASTDAVDPSLLAGTTSQLARVPLAAPAAGAGFQLRMPPFTIGAGKEREVLYYAPVGNTQEAWVKRIQTNMRAGSHHFVLYTFGANTPSLLVPTPGALRDLRDENGTYNLATLAAMPYRVFFAGSQSTASDYTFPAGVALRLPAGAAIDINSHYVNTTTGAAIGEAEANLYTVAAAEVQFEAQSLNLNNTDLTVPAGRDTTIRRTFRFTKTTRIVMLTSHMHKRGLRFVIRIAGGARDGGVVYDNSSWDSPVILALGTPLTLQAGEGLTSEVTYRGDPTRVVRFGLTADDEMNIIFGYAY